MHGGLPAPRRRTSESSPRDDQRAGTAGAPRVLIVDDEEAARALLRETLEISGFQVAGEAATGDEALRLLDDLDVAPSAIIVDHHMPGLTGLETADQILTASPDQIVILFSGALTTELIARASSVGVLQCIDKLEVGRLPAVLHTLLGTQKWMNKRAAARSRSAGRTTHEPPDPA